MGPGNGKLGVIVGHAESHGAKHRLRAERHADGKPVGRDDPLHLSVVFVARTLGDMQLGEPGGNERDSVGVIDDKHVLLLRGDGQLTSGRRAGNGLLGMEPGNSEPGARNPYDQPLEPDDR